MTTIEVKLLEFRQKFGRDPDVFLVGRGLWPEQFKDEPRFELNGVLYVRDEFLGDHSMVMATREAIRLRGH